MFLISTTWTTNQMSEKYAGSYLHYNRYIDLAVAENQ